jgi:thymidylate synthase
MKSGEDIKDERFQNTKETMNLFVELSNPLKSEAPKGNPFSGEKLKAYEDQFLNDEKEGFTYTYGNRYRAHFKVKWEEEYSKWFGLKKGTKEHKFSIDQINNIILRLGQCKESRRAIGVTWDPSIDSQQDEVPCNIYTDFKIRDGKLQVTSMWRSHDIYGAWVANLFSLVKLAEYVAYSLRIPVGTILVHSISAHIYEYDWEEAELI